ncbi:MAG: hypothetical protein KJ077_35750 [Anaerolineae bacterium]|nr:hypothetical protein [Anaerolineae bacterium]
MIDYFEVIQTLYPAAILDIAGEGNVGLTTTGEPPDLVTVISKWTLPDPQPAIEELDAYAASPEYRTAWGARLKAEAEAQVNQWANEIVVRLKIIEPELFYVAMVSNIAFRLLEWNSLGQPEAVDPARFIVTHSEAAAYAETSAPGMTPAGLLRLQESRWTAMQQGFAAIVYQRRLALERIKLAPVDENLPAALAGVLTQMRTVL